MGPTGCPALQNDSIRAERYSFQVRLPNKFWPVLFSGVILSHISTCVAFWVTSLLAPLFNVNPCRSGTSSASHTRALLLSAAFWHLLCCVACNLRWMRDRETEREGIISLIHSFIRSFIHSADMNVVRNMDGMQGKRKER